MSFLCIVCVCVCFISLSRSPTTHPKFYNNYNINISSLSFSLNLLANREENRTEEPQFDGPDGMDPEGVIESSWNEVVHHFDDMDLKEELLRGIYAYGYERPSAIQARAILPCIKERDVIAQAQSGMCSVSDGGCLIIELFRMRSLRSVRM